MLPPNFQSNLHREKLEKFRAAVEQRLEWIANNQEVSATVVTATALVLGWFVASFWRGNLRNRRTFEEDILAVQHHIQHEFQYVHSPERPSTPVARCAASPNPPNADNSHVLRSKKKNSRPRHDLDVPAKPLEGSLEPMGVAVRCRPLYEYELDIGYGVEVDSSKALVSDLARSNTIKFDAVFDHEADQTEVYMELVSPLVESVMTGHNATVFAYGQTLSGKTFSILGEEREPCLGMAPLALKHIFESIGVNKGGEQVTVAMSALAMHENVIQDLLVSDHDDTDSVHMVFNPFIDAFEVAGHAVVKLDCFTDGLEVLRMADDQMNELAQRQILPQEHSHSAYVITVECGGTFGRLQLFDLAGSQAKRHPERPDEGKRVDLDISNLARCFIELSMRNNRDMKVLGQNGSMVVQMMSPALGGNSRTVMLAHISPAADDVEETFRTLRYAEVAQGVSNKVHVNAKMGEDRKWLAEQRLVSAWKTRAPESKPHSEQTSDGIDGPDHPDYIFKRLQELLCERKYRIYQLFCQMSCDNEGRLSSDELLRFVRNIVPELTPQQSRRFKALAEADGPGPFSFHEIGGVCRRCKAVGVSSREKDTPANGILMLAGAFGPDASAMEAKFLTWDIYGDGLLDHLEILHLLRRDLPLAGPEELRMIIGELDELLTVDADGKLSLEGIKLACQAITDELS